MFGIVVRQKQLTFLVKKIKTTTIANKMKFTTNYVEILVTLVICTLLHPTQGVFEENNCLSSNAEYNQTIGRCECANGFKGLGDLCCHSNDGYDTCTLGGDPWLTSYDSTQSPIYFPCIGRMSVINSQTARADSCVVEVLSSTKDVKYGVEYPDRMIVSVNIKNTGRQLFKFVGNTLQRPGDSQFYTSTELYRNRLTRPRIQGERFLIKYLSARQIWTLIGCSTQVTFRAAQNDEAVQFIRPGICVSVKKDSNASPSGDLSNGDLCSLSSTSLTSPSAVYNQILYKQIVDYSKAVNADERSVHPDYQQVCDKIETVATQECAPSGLEPSVSKCGPLLSNSAIRRCVAEKGVVGQALLSLFQQCLHYECTGDRDGCKDAMKSNDAVNTCVPTFCDM